jgi:membrane-associated protease RseP (regulator of RpoE activity)
MLLAGAIYTYEGPTDGSDLDIIMGLLGSLKSGIPFGLSLLAILMTHEFGHYLAGRFNKTHVTLPYFIPFPLSPFGTMGAFIQLKERPKNRRVLLDIGIAGPLAGLVVTIPILFIGLSLSSIDIIPSVVPAGESLSIEGNSIFYLLAKYIVHGEWLPAPASYGGVSPLIYWIRYLFTGFPMPLGGRDVFLHPMAWAGWAGLLVTALNLIPAGQLDGGHVLYVLFGKKARRILPIILVSLIMLGLAWMGWWIWVFLIYFFGRHHAEPLDQITQLDSGRKFLAVFTLILFFLIFIPVPLSIIPGPFVGP